MVRKNPFAEHVHFPPMMDDEETEAVLKVIKSKKLTILSGNKVRKFEDKFAEYTGTKHAIAVNSGTAALHVSLASLDIGAGDEVIVPPFTFVATATAVIHQNA